MFPVQLLDGGGAMMEIIATAAFGIAEEWDLLAFDAAAELFEGGPWEVLLTSGAAPLGATAFDPEANLESKIIMCVQPESLAEFVHAPEIAGSMGIVMLPDPLALAPALQAWAATHTAPWNSILVETQPGGSGRLVVFETHVGPVNEDGARVAFRAWGVVPLNDDGTAAFVDLVTFDGRYIDALKHLCRQVIAHTGVEEGR